MSLRRVHVRNAHHIDGQAQTHCANKGAITASLDAAARITCSYEFQGDNNWGDDRALYNEGQQWLNLNHLMGRVVG